MRYKVVSFAPTSAALVGEAVYIRTDGITTYRPVVGWLTVEWEGDEEGHRCVVAGVVDGSADAPGADVIPAYELHDFDHLVWNPAAAR